MSQWILKANGKVVPRRSCRPLTTAEINSESEQKKRRIFDELIEGRWGNTINPRKSNIRMPRKSKKDLSDDFIEYEDDEEDPRIIPETEEGVDAQGRAINVNPPYDKLIHAEV